MKKKIEKKFFFEVESCLKRIKFNLQMRALLCQVSSCCFNLSYVWTFRVSKFCIAFPFNFVYLLESMILHPRDLYFVPRTNRGSKFPAVYVATFRRTRESLSSLLSAIRSSVLCYVGVWCRILFCHKARTYRYLFLTG